MTGLAKGTGTIATDPLAYYTQETFAQYINSVFRLHGFITVDVTLLKVQDTLPTKVARLGGRESFVLHFVGGNVQLPQDTYTVEHPALGTFRLFLVPSGAVENGAQRCSATINRLAYDAKPGARGKATLRKTASNPKPETESPGPPPIPDGTISPGTEASQAISPSSSGTPTKNIQPRKRKTDPELLPEFDIQ